jgi:rRNA maturation RNase YbeY
MRRAVTSSLQDDLVAVINRQRKVSIDTQQLQRAVSEILAQCGEEGQEVTVVLVSDRTMRTINRDYRGINAATDVISFAMREGPGGDLSGTLLGDLVISLETVGRQSGEPFDDGRPDTGTTQRELALMTIHGLLHLLGHAHESGGKAEEQMIERENELFQTNWQLFPSF